MHKKLSATRLNDPKLERTISFTEFQTVKIRSISECSLQLVLALRIINLGSHPPLVIESRRAKIFGCRYTPQGL